jgi:3-methylcrotonyl-CoA carboxylase alpha subunit
MFDKVLIANRGEIACRIIRTARDMGLSTVAVYSQADISAMHRNMADESVCIGGTSPAESYLRGDVIIAAAQATGAQAIHPGYGFLSENPDFVDAVEAAGLIFVGPSSAAIRSMGLKDAAKALMAEAGVPVVPGFHGRDQSLDRLSSEAHKIGYPVLIKAVAGGGGKGMRLVQTRADFESALQSARAEAQASFGNPDVLVEKFVTSPRHIEVQIFGDGSRAVHLYERDCSLQRRHQKVIEEAPAPGMTPEVRASMGAAAVRAAEAIGYKGAGTVEFIVDGSGPLRTDGFWFMEMNTRLQVEHPVTEAVTGIDMVAWQLQIAAGGTLPVRQEDIPLQGHAFEARLYAENVPAGFLPATGRLAHLKFPGWARSDTGVASGDAILPYYDPMIAKVITHAADRPTALRQLQRALYETEVAGTVTNRDFLGALTRNSTFIQAEMDTGLIERELASLSHVPAPPIEIVAYAMWIASGLQDAPDWASGFSLWQPIWHSMSILHDGAEIEGRVQVNGRLGVVELAGSGVHLEFGPQGWRISGAAVLRWHKQAGEITIFDQYTWVFTCVDHLDRDTTETASDVVKAPMPGLLRKIATGSGQFVRKGDSLAVLEAMKMEHVLVAPRDGAVAEVLAVAGSQVEAGTALIRLEEEN